MKLSLLTEGSSDVVLLRPLRWLIDDIDQTLEYRLERVDFTILPNPPGSLEEKIVRAVELERPNVLLIHRDADERSATRRYSEIDEAARRAVIDVSHISVVPVTMTESWFLFDEKALRKAAGCPNGTVKLTLPAPDRLRCKGQLHEQLKVASEKNGRHLRKLRPEDMFHVLAENIDDFSPLEKLASFRRLRQDLVAALTSHIENAES